MQGSNKNETPTIGVAGVSDVASQAAWKAENIHSNGAMKEGSDMAKTRMTLLDR